MYLVGVQVAVSVNTSQFHFKCWDRTIFDHFLQNVKDSRKYYSYNSKVIFLFDARKIVNSAQPNDSQGLFYYFILYLKFIKRTSNSAKPVGCCKLLLENVLFLLSYSWFAQSQNVFDCSS